MRNKRVELAIYNKYDNLTTYIAYYVRNLEEAFDIARMHAIKEDVHASILYEGTSYGYDLITCEQVDD